ncbi:hypothetical protein RJ640_024870 [Escallonia rubra]|uniref:RING-type E3 ubiquitin transferase n=1 Tax=Escallonia rubra TaxID=112253 RepID=A0AA88UTA6_9ASTE|nr:hypothetical protein RJ640_024870 [Escallonia rubra]
MGKPLGPTGEFFRRRDEWRKHPMLTNQFRHAAPGLGIALVAFGVYLLLLLPGDQLLRSVNKVLWTYASKGRTTALRKRMPLLRVVLEHVLVGGEGGRGEEGEGRVVVNRKTDMSFTRKKNALAELPIVQCLKMEENSVGPVGGSLCTNCAPGGKREMWPRGNNGERAPATHQLVAVAIDRDKGSKIALKWTIDTLLSKGQTLVLVHVKVKPSGSSTPRTNQISDVNNGTGRFKAKDIPGSVSKGAPDFCTVYVISKGKISSTRAASRPPPNVSPLRNQILSQASSRHDPSETQTPPTSSSKGIPRPQSESPQHSLHNDANIIKSPFTHRRGPNGKSYGELSSPDTDISFVSSGRPSIDRLFPSYGDSFEMGATPRFSNFSDVDRQSFESFRIGRKSADSTTPPELSYSSFESDMSSPSQATVNVRQIMGNLAVYRKKMLKQYCKAKLFRKGRDEEAKAGAQANNGHVQYCLQRSNLGKTEGM